MCREYVSTNCIKNCINKETIRCFNRTSTMSNHISGDLKIVTNRFLNSGHGHTTKYLNIVSECRKSCPWNDCESVVTISSTGDSSDWNRFMLYQMPPNAPSIIISSHPSVVGIDYITLVLSCLGTWIGFSFVGVNPFTRKNKNKVENSERSNIHSIVKELTNSMLIEQRRQNHCMNLITIDINRLKLINSM